MRCRAREDAHNLPSNFMSIPAFTHNQTANTPSFFEASLFFLLNLHIATWWWLHLLMPININYSRKIAKLLKVIDSDKGSKTSRLEWKEGWKKHISHISTPTAAATFIIIIGVVFPVFRSSRKGATGNIQHSDWWKNFSHCFGIHAATFSPFSLLPLFLPSFIFFSTWTNFMKSDVKGGKIEGKQEEKIWRQFFYFLSSFSCHKKQHKKAPSTMKGLRWETTKALWGRGKKLLRAKHFSRKINWSTNGK